MEIKRRNNESIDSLIRRFKKAAASAGIRHELRKHENYKKPSDIKNIKNQDLKFRKKKQKIKREKERQELKTRKRRAW